MTPKQANRPATGQRNLSDPLLRPSEVAAVFLVDPKTVARWAREKKIPARFTPGGHRRYRESDVRRFLDGEEGAPVSPRAAA